MKSAAVLAMFAALALSACASPTDHGWTLCPDGQPWQRTEGEPEDADEMRRLADSTAYYPGEWWEHERWYSLSTGEIMLCRAGELEREWWQFRQTADGPELIGHDGIII